MTPPNLVSQSPAWPVLARCTFFGGSLCLTLAALLSGCKLGPNYQRPDVPTAATWRTAAPITDSLANAAWWDFYRDPVLVNLIHSALANNKDLRIAAARVEQALAGYRAQRSYLLPGIDASATWTRARTGDIPPAPGAHGNQFDVFGLLSYEVDIWGRLRRLTESARAELLASEEGMKAVSIGLVASVAATYFDLRALDEQLEIARRTYTSRTNALELTRVKFDDGNGVASELDVRQAETQVHVARSSIASLERVVIMTENALAVLLGSNPGPIPRGEAPEQLALPGEVPAGLPSDLLLRRPDLRAAEQKLIAANADIGAARAAYFPAISLTAALGLQSLDLDNLFDPGLSRAWRFAPQIAGPIFHAGRIRAGTQLAEAVRTEALAGYEQAIQNAFREVEDALVSVTKLRDQIAADDANVQAERKRLELSQLRYDSGIASYSDVLDAERFLFNAELTLVQSRRDLFQSGAQLYKALGGGWTPPSTW